MEKEYGSIAFLRFGLCIIAILFSCSQSGNKTNKTDFAFSSQNEGCSAPDVLNKTWYTSGNKAPLFDGLEGIHFKISTKSEEAQKYFDQGMMLAYGFNHVEAARSFFEAARLDSACGICWWGYAYVLGPNYNSGMDPDNFKRAFNAVLKAQMSGFSASAKEKALIKSLSLRYSKDNRISRFFLDSLFASSMRTVYNEFSDDPDVAALFAESLMDMHPWNMFKKDGSIQPWTSEIIKVLETGLKKYPKHAGLNHFYIHAMEMSSHPEKALASADLLRDLVPAAGHLVHMPSHIYIRIGRYYEGVLSNLNAVMVDSLYVEACHAQGSYPLVYYPHNSHFLAACATLCGESKNAMIGANETMMHAHKKLLLDPAWATLQHYYTIPLYVMVKLGLWTDIQNSREPAKELNYPRIIWHYARGMAALSQNNLESADKHLAEMKSMMIDTSLRKLTIWNINSLIDLCMIASKTLEGEILAKKKDYSGAIRFLNEAVKIEDALNYSEPPDWFFSVRHNLGAVLIDAGKYQEAISIYNEDLKTYPENGWTLIGLVKAYEKLGDKIKYNEMKKRFNAAWINADIKIGSSRIL